MNWPTDKDLPALDHRWVESVVRHYRSGGSVSQVIARDFKRTCDLPNDIAFEDAVIHAEKLLVVWQVSDRLAA